MYINCNHCISFTFTVVVQIFWVSVDYSSIRYRFSFKSKNKDSGYKSKPHTTQRKTDVTLTRWRQITSVIRFYLTKCSRVSQASNVSPVAVPCKICTPCNMLYHTKSSSYVSRLLAWFSIPDLICHCKLISMYYLGVGSNDLEGLLDLLGRGTTTYIQEVGWAAPVQLDDVHCRHSQPCSIHQAPDITCQNHTNCLLEVTLVLRLLQTFQRV